MAAIVKIDRNNSRGNEVAAAIDNIRNGLATLKKLDGMRAEAVGAGGTVFADTFGITAEAQAMSDRWSAISGGVYTGLPDFLNATIAD
jgi:translation initiation factor 1 (eIF-1/SUI1)